MFMNFQLFHFGLSISATGLTRIPAKHVLQIFHGLVHSSPQLSARGPFVIIVPGFNQQLLVLFSNSDILVFVQREEMFLVVVVVENDPALGSWCSVELMGFLLVEFLDSVLCLDFVERNLLSDRSPKALILICLLVVREMLGMCVLLLLLGHNSESLIFIFELGDSHNL
jgi:hypothetical protein